MGGRFIDTAVKHRKQVMFKKIVKSMEDVGLNTFCKERSGCVIQFIYGDDGMDAVL